MHFDCGKQVKGISLRLFPLFLGSPEGTAGALYCIYLLLLNIDFGDAAGFYAVEAWPLLWYDCGSQSAVFGCKAKTDDSI